MANERYESERMALERWPGGGIHFEHGGQGRPLAEFEWTLANEILILAGRPAGTARPNPGWFKDLPHALHQPAATGKLLRVEREGRMLVTHRLFEAEGLTGREEVTTVDECTSEEAALELERQLREEAGTVRIVEQSDERVAWEAGPLPTEKPRDECRDPRCGGHDGAPALGSDPVVIAKSPLLRVVEFMDYETGMRVKRFEIFDGVDLMGQHRWKSPGVTNIPDWFPEEAAKLITISEEEYPALPGAERS